ncbi:putative BPI/LBP family protein At1g04970 [Tripterygium wilfordii]|nr:putative BPI/LBP family protein At1g04970 [Tripterygium wilfordii]
MGFFLKSITHSIFVIISSFLLIPARTHLQSHEESYISLVISSKGLEFAKDLLVEKAVSTLIPLQVPDIEKTVNIPVVGKVNMGLSNITISGVNIASSLVETGENGIVLVASGATANLSMNWWYSYRRWFITIRDEGEASVQVENMQVGITATIKEEEGTIKLFLLDCGCSVEDISIDLDGGASWLYQGLVDAFQGKIRSAVEDAISKNIKEGMKKLSSKLQSLPKRISVDDIMDMNVTFVDDPTLSHSSVEFDINGLFTAADEISISDFYRRGSQTSVSFDDPTKMIKISLHENVFYTAALVYFEKGYMHWNFDEIPEQSLLNTAGWRYIVPQLYDRYPNDDMMLNVSVASPPVIKVINQVIDATVSSYLTIDVLDAGEVIPVACISMIIRASCSPEVSGNNLVGTVSLIDFTLSLEWSRIGNLHLNLVQPVISVILKTVLFPYVNVHLRKGFPLPLLHGFEVREAEIFYMDSNVIVCSDLASTKGSLQLAAI